MFVVRRTTIWAALFACGAAACAAARVPDRVGVDAGLSVDAETPHDGATEQVVAEGDLLLQGANLLGGGPVDVEIRGGRIVAVRPASAPPTQATRGVRTLNLAGRWLAPAFIDSHVHLTYWPVAKQLLRGGVVAAVDLAAPESTLTRTAASPLRLVASGPMITALGGYPLDSWGRDGYGTECQTVEQAIATVDRLIDAGAGVIKLPLGQGRPLSVSVAEAAIVRAHQRGRKVAVHATSDAAAALGARLGADILAHTPTEALSPTTIEAWRGRTVISTLSAFGGSDATIANLRALRAAGVVVIYGTDLGNTRDARIDARELELLGRAGLDGAAIIESATASPARLWGWDDLGSVAPGKNASLLVLDADPVAQPSTLAAPMLVIANGDVLP